MRQTRIRAGELRTPLFLGSPVFGQDPAGARTISSWTETQVFGKVMPASGREWLNNGILKDQVDSAIILRYIPGKVPNALWRVRDPNTGTIYPVLLVLVDPRQSVVELGCKAMIGNPSDGR